MENVDFSICADPGLYLLWPDGNRMELTRAFIEDSTRRMLADPDRIPLSVRAAAAYRPCDICPERDQAVICHAIMPVLPFLVEVDRYMSYDRVTAVYREDGSDILNVVETSMQEALKFICILSVTQYCEVGHQYQRFFAGVNPLMPPDDLAEAVYRNIFLDAQGNREQVALTILRMQEQLLHTTRCQMARVKLVCKQDAFVNAYVSTYAVIQILFTMLDSFHHKRRVQADGQGSADGGPDAATGLDHGM